MNLLTDAWIPIQQFGIAKKVTLQQLLCNEKSGELCLPRDDMEFACLQLIIALTQVLFTPVNKSELVKRIKQPLSAEEYTNGCEGKLDWFDLNHPETPFMQFRGVKAKEATPMDKLMAGVADGTNKSFVNPQGLATQLCTSCTAIALYNVAYNSPSMGGGFKSGMRGSTPISVIISASNLRQLVWYNVMSEESLELEMPWHQATCDQAPNYVSGFAKDSKLSTSAIGLTKGLLWQPARFELIPTDETGRCSCCGQQDKVYRGFNKEKFNYTIDGIWPHPLSARVFALKKGEREEKFPSFTTTQPSWVHLAKLVVDIKQKKEGNQPAPVITQLKTFSPQRLNMIVGGYRNNQATVLERRHEMFSLAANWKEQPQVIDGLINKAQEYKKALRKALYIFGEGIKDRFAGAGVDLTDRYDAVFYQQTENLIHDALATIDFEHPQETLDPLYSSLKKVVLTLFQQATAPYQQEPKMLKALASSRRLLNTYLNNIEQKGGHYDSAEKA